MSAKSKKHHYVPQSILRRFSSNPAQTQLYVFDKIEEKTYSSSIKNTGSENRFNTVEVNGESHNFENLFQNIDGELASLLDHITNNQSLEGITAKDRVILSQVIAVQIVRTKMWRTTQHSVARQTANSLRKSGFDPENIRGFSIPTEQDVRKNTLASLLNLNEYINILNTKDVILIKGVDQSPFWISDNPIVLHNSFPYGDQGLSSPGVELYFPISSDLVIGLYCPSIKRKISKAKLGASLQLDPDKDIQILHGLSTGHAVSLGSETVKFLNSLQIINSSRFLYSSTDNFEYAYETINLNPSLKNVQSHVRVGDMGMGMPKRESMPHGLWVVLYGTEDHHLIKVDRWHKNSQFIDFETADIQTLKEVLKDKPSTLAVLFEDGHELRGMRSIKVEIKKGSVSYLVHISHEDEGLNKILLNRS